MAIDFPTATSVGQTYTDPTSGNTYVVTVVGPPAQWVGSGSSTSLDNTYLRKDASNDPVTGTLTVTPATNVEGLVVTQPSGNSAAAMRITNEGSGNSLVVEDSANPDSTPFVIRSDGTTLIGTTSPRNNFFNSSFCTPILQVEGANTGTTGRFYSLTYGENTVAAPVLIFSKHRSNSLGGNTAVVSGDEAGQLSFQASDGTEFIETANIRAEIDGTPGANDMPGRLLFSTTADGLSTPTERMRISQNGYINFVTAAQTIHNTTTTGFSYQPSGWASFNSGFESLLLTQQNQTAWIRFYFQNGGEKGSITYNGTGTSYNTTSDYRLKENVVTINNSIARLQQLKPCRFNFIQVPATVVDGFIAHEVQEVVPEAITGEKDAEDEDGNPIYQGIDQSKLVPLLTAALQEAVAKIESLEARLTAAGI